MAKRKKDEDESQFDIWYTDTKRELKKDVDKDALDYIRDIVVGNTVPHPPKVRSRVQSVETDGGSLIAWRRGSRIFHMLVPDSGQILVRGIDNWPRGMTRRYEQMTKILDARINGDSDEKPMREFLARGPITELRLQNRAKAERKQNRTIKLKKKKK